MSLRLPQTQKCLYHNHFPCLLPVAKLVLLQGGGCCMWTHPLWDTHPDRTALRRPSPPRPTIIIRVVVGCHQVWVVTELTQQGQACKHLSRLASSRRRTKLRHYLSVLVPAQPMCSHHKPPILLPTPLLTSGDSKIPRTRRTFTRQVICMFTKLDGISATVHTQSRIPTRMQTQIHTRTAHAHVQVPDLQSLTQHCMELRTPQEVLVQLALEVSEAAEQDLQVTNT